MEKQKEGLEKNKDELENWKSYTLSSIALLAVIGLKEYMQMR